MTLPPRGGGTIRGRAGWCGAYPCVCSSSKRSGDTGCPGAALHRLERIWEGQDPHDGKVGVHLPMGGARWPLDFGLLNQDCLWVMDEVQLMDVGRDRTQLPRT